MLEPMVNKPPHIPVFINEPRLSDLRQVLIKSGIQAEFNGEIVRGSLFKSGIQAEFNGEIFRGSLFTGGVLV